MPCGNVGKWYNSKEDFKPEYMAESDKWNAKLDNEEIDWDTHIHSCAGGYELWSCPKHWCLCIIPYYLLILPIWWCVLNP